MFIEGEFIDTVCGIPGSRTEVLGLNFPGGRGSSWRGSSPDHTPGSPDAMATELGLRNVGLEVETSRRPWPPRGGWVRPGRRHR